MIQCEKVFEIIFKLINVDRISAEIFFEKEQGILILRYILEKVYKSNNALAIKKMRNDNGNLYNFLNDNAVSYNSLSQNK